MRQIPHHIDNMLPLIRTIYENGGTEIQTSAEYPISSDGEGGYFLRIDENGMSECRFTFVIKSAATRYQGTYGPPEFNEELQKKLDPRYEFNAIVERKPSN